MPIIKPSTAMRTSYNEIAEICKVTKEPVYLTKNGEGELVVMDIETFNAREAALDLRERLKEIEDARENGVKDIPASQVSKMMRDAINEVQKDN